MLYNGIGSIGSIVDSVVIKMASAYSRFSSIFKKIFQLAWIYLCLTACIKPTTTPIFPGSESGSHPASGLVTIAMIQGAGHLSPYLGQQVSDIEGLVTVLRSDGFYMQSIQPDDDPATSEGMFVFTEWVPTVAVGDRVLVDGHVVEYIPGGGLGNLSVTQLADVEVTILSRGNTLPSPEVIGEGGRLPPGEVIDDDSQGFISAETHFDPENDGIDFYESLEGMLVQVNQAVVVGPTNTYKEIVVLGDGGEWASVRTGRGGILPREGDFNPERIILDDLLAATPFVKVGDQAVDPIVGVMDYDYGNYKFLVIETPEFGPGGLQREKAAEPADPSQLRVASYNVQNLSQTQPERLAALADQIVNQLHSPDIIALQEIMDDDGSEGGEAISAELTFLGLIDAIQALGGPVYGFLDIDPLSDEDGGVPQGNIRVGFLYRFDTGLSLADAPRGDAQTPISVVDQSGVPTLSLNPGRIAPTHPAFTSSRKPLVAVFHYHGQPLLLINNHFISKGEDGDLFGEFQPPIQESEEKRIQQAQVVHDFVADVLAVDPESWVIVLGDLNDFQFSPALDVLKGDILNNLIDTLPLEQQYTTIFDGNSQTLDHILVSKGFLGSVAAMDVVHLNAEFDYAQRFSDHDVPVATFEID